MNTKLWDPPNARDLLQGEQPMRMRSVRCRSGLGSNSARHTERRAELDLRRSQRGKIDASYRSAAQLAKYAIQKDYRDLGGRGDLDSQRLAARREIDDQAWVNAARTNALGSRGAREVEIRGKGSAV